MILELLVSGQLTLSRPDLTKLVDIRPNLETNTTQIEPLEASPMAEAELVAPIPVEPVVEPVRALGDKAPVGWYPKGQCTYWVWSKRHVPGWNDASDWRWQAERDGWTVSAQPVVGAIAWQYGHVALVEAFSDTTVTISEMNYHGLGVVSHRTLPINTFRYIYE